MVISGLKSSQQRRIEARKLMEWGFRRFRSFAMFDQGQTVGYARVWGGSDTWVELVTNEEIKLNLTQSERRNLKAEIIYKGPLRPPIREGAQIATLRFRVGDKLISEKKLHGINQVDRDERTWKRAIDTLMFMALGG